MPYVAILKCYYTMLHLTGRLLLYSSSSVIILNKPNNTQVRGCYANTRHDRVAACESDCGRRRGRGTTGAADAKRVGAVV